MNGREEVAVSSRIEHMFDNDSAADPSGDSVESRAADCLASCEAGSAAPIEAGASVGSIRPELSEADASEADASGLDVAGRGGVGDLWAVVEGVLARAGAWEWAGCDMREVLEREAVVEDALQAWERVSRVQEGRKVVLLEALASVESARQEAACHGGVVPAHGVPGGFGALEVDQSVAASAGCILGVSGLSASRMVGAARRLCLEAPGALAALRGGAISRRQAEVIAAEVAAAPVGQGCAVEGREALQAHLLERCDRMDAGALRRCARRWVARRVPEAMAEYGARAGADRGVRLVDDVDCMSWLSARIPSVQAHAIFNRLSSVADAARREPGEDRSVSQLRADALMGLLMADRPGTPSAPGTASSAASAERAAPASPGTASAPGAVLAGAVVGPVGVDPVVRFLERIRPSVAVTVPALSLVADPQVREALDVGGPVAALAGHGPIPEAVACRLVGEAASVVRILTDPQTGAVLSVGRRRYSPPADLRTYLRLRDETCRFPGCSQAAQRCDVDHTVAWDSGGQTAAENLGHLCRKHHRLKHEAGWRLEQAASGMMCWRSPTGRAYRTYSPWQDWDDLDVPARVTFRRRRQLDTRSRQAHQRAAQARLAVLSADAAHALGVTSNQDRAEHRGAKHRGGVRSPHSTANPGHQPTPDATATDPWATDARTADP